MSVEEFLEQGFLQEANRQFFHKCGIALSITISDDGNFKLGPIWDCRDDPEGLIFSSVEEENQAIVRQWKFENVKQLMDEKRKTRLEKLGYDEQPVEEIVKVKDV